MNAADEKQVKKAAEKERDVRKRELDDIRAILAMAAGKRFVWRLLARTKAFGSVFDREALEMAHKAGAQDVGHFILAEVGEADALAIPQMMIDAHKDEQAQEAS